MYVYEQGGHDIDDEMDAYRKKSGPTSASHDTAPDLSNMDDDAQIDGDDFGASPPPTSKPYAARNYRGCVFCLH
jgi:hypothetical protein